MMQGMWIHISRAMTNAYGKDQFSGKDLAEAWGIIFKDSPKRIATLTKVEALNADFGMANMDADIVQKNSVNLVMVLRTLILIYYMFVIELLMYIIEWAY